MLPTTSVHVLEQHPKQFRQPCRRCISGIRETGFFYSWPLSSVSHIFRFLVRMQPSLYVLTSLFAFSLLLSSQLMLCLLLDVCDFFGLFFVLLFLCVCGFSLFCHFLLVFNLLFVKIKKIKDKKKISFPLGEQQQPSPSKHHSGSRNSRWLWNSEHSFGTMFELLCGYSGK